MAEIEINFCRRCGSAMEQRVPQLEDRVRAVCPACGYIDYVNPLNVVGTVPVLAGENGPRILLCRRAIEPRRGYWTLPAGFMETGETSAEGALRETREEAGADVVNQGLYCIFDVVHTRQVHLFYRAQLNTMDLEPGPETIENGIFAPADIPWSELAFHTARHTLQFWLADLERGDYPLHTGSVSRTGKLT